MTANFWTRSPIRAHFRTTRRPDAPGRFSSSIVAGLFTDPRARSRALGIWAGIGGLAATLGVVLSGVITQYASWRCGHTTGLASGLVTTTRRLGGAFGPGLLSTLAIHRSTASPASGTPVEAALTQGLRLAFEAGSASLALAALLVGVDITAGAGTAPAPTR